MMTIAIADGAFEVDATVVAEGLGLALADLKAGMRAGRITTLAERGTDADLGRHRLTFFSKHRRLRLVIDERGTIIQRSTLDFGDAPLPASTHRSGS